MACFINVSLLLQRAFDLASVAKHQINAGDLGSCLFGTMPRKTACSPPNDDRNSGDLTTEPRSLLHL